MLGTVERRRAGFFLRAFDRNLRAEIRLADLAGAAPDEIVRVRVARWTAHGPALGRIVARFGPLDAPGAISLMALLHHAIPIEFPSGALAEAEAVPHAELGARDDLRAIPFVTIDGPDARDFDDAVQAEPDRDPANHGGHRIRVAIADVAHYVRPGGALDAAARERGNSVYFPDRVVPMLPERLSNDLCSLRPGEDRAALVAEIVVDRNGVPRSRRFRRAMIRSAARLTYEAVEHARDRPHPAVPADVQPALKRLHTAWAALGRERAKRQPLAIEGSERKVAFDREGRIAAIAPAPHFASHRLIEDFMILANVAVAEELAAHGVPALRRIHDPPDPVRIETLRRAVAAAGHRFARGQGLRPMHFNAILEWAAGTPQARMLGELVLRTQSLAVYGAADRGHFGLALARYCHFTSPIRRYADLVVHRALVAALGLGDGGGQGGDLDALALHLSLTERRATAAERDAMDRYAARLLADRVGAVFEGHVSGVAPFGAFVTLAETGADGLVPLALLPADDWRTEPGIALAGRHYRLAVGDPVEVRLAGADPVDGRLTFALMGTPERHAKHAGPARRQGRDPRRGR